MNKRLTNSEMATFRRCKRKWWLSQVRGLRKRTIDFNRPLSIGSRLHECLAAHYSPGDERRDPLEVLRETLVSDWKDYPSHESDITKEGDLCEAMLTGYMQWLEETGADADLTVLWSEDAVEVELIPGVNLLTKIDARVLRGHDNARLALEHKSVGDLSTPLLSLQQDTQLLTEHLAEFLHLRNTGEMELRAEGVLYNMLRKSKRTARAKPPFYGRETVMHNTEELWSHWVHVATIAREMLDAEARLAAGESHHSIVYPNPTKDCKWDCQYFGICPMFDDGSDVEAAIGDLYTVEDPLERYSDLVKDVKK